MAKPSSSDESLSNTSSSYSREETPDDDDANSGRPEVSMEAFAARVAQIVRLDYEILKIGHPDDFDGLKTEETILRAYRRRLGLDAIDEKERLQQIRDEEADEKFVAGSNKYSEQDFKAIEDEPDSEEDSEDKDGAHVVVRHVKVNVEKVADNEMASPIPLQAVDMPAHNMQAREQKERKRKLTRYIPDAADAVNNDLEEMTQLPDSKKIHYAHDDDDEEIQRKVSRKQASTN